MNRKRLLNFISQYRVELFIFLMTLFIFSINILDFPFQGEIYYAYIGQELLRGFSIFSTTIAVKPPMIYFFDALLMKLFFFLPNYLAIRVGMLFLSSITMILFYKVLKKITNDNLIPIFSVLIALSFVYFVQDSLNGGIKPLILFFVFLQFLALFKKNYLISGFFASLCFLTWQPSGLLLFGPFVYSFLNKEGVRRYLEIISGFIIPIALIVVYFFSNGLLNKFIEYVFVLPLSFNTGNFEWFNWLKFSGLVGYYNTELFFILFSIFGVILVFFDIFGKLERKKVLKIIEKRKNTISFLFPFFLLFLYSIFDFQGSDDVIILLPAISLFAGTFLRRVSKKLTVTLVVWLIILYGFSPYLQLVYPENPLITSSKETSNMTELMSVANEYTVAELIYYGLLHRKGEEMTLRQQLEMAEYIKSNTEVDDKIFSMGSPELLFLSNRRNINDYFYLTTRVYSEHAKKGDVLSELRKNLTEENPKFIVSRNVWMVQRVINLLDIENYLKWNYLDINIHPEYIIWERKG